MATGSGPLGQNLRDGGTSNITPTYEVPNQARLYEEMGDALARISAPVQDAFDRRAARKGRQAEAEAAAKRQADIQDGKTPARIKSPRVDILTHGAYAAAFNAATLARLKSDLDSYDDKLRGKHQYDPQGYQDASAKALSGFIQGAPEEMAVEIETYGQTKFADSYSAISRVAEERARQEAGAELGVRIKTLDERLKALAADGKVGEDEFARVDAERTILQVERERNPAIIYGPEQRAYDDERLYGDLHGAAAAHTAGLIYGEAGKGPPGVAEAKAYLKSEILEGEAFVNMAPERRQAIYESAKRTIDAQSEADIEAARAEAAAEREKRALEREIAGSLRLAISLGEVGEKAIQARDDISDADKASLIGAARAYARREQADARQAAALERAGQAATYREFADAADAGTLSEADIADARSSGLLSPGQARTLAAKRDKSLGPVIADIMAPVRDFGANAKGRPSNELVARAEEMAVVWARSNPNATLEERLKYGRVVAERVYGAPKSTPGPEAANSKATSKAAKYAALKRQRAAGEINQSTYITRMEELNNAR